MWSIILLKYLVFSSMATATSSQHLVEDTEGENGGAKGVDDGEEW